MPCSPHWGAVNMGLALVGSPSRGRQEDFMVTYTCTRVQSADMGKRKCHRNVRKAAWHTWGGLGTLGRLPAQMASWRVSQGWAEGEWGRQERGIHRTECTGRWNRDKGVLSAPEGPGECEGRSGRSRGQAMCWAWEAMSRSQGLVLRLWGSGKSFKQESLRDRFPS